MTPEEAKKLALAIKEEIISVRREFHAYPELGFKEFRTSERIAELLDSWGYEVEKGIAKTGVIGKLKGDEEGPSRALRADMDALPITEETNLEFSSKNRGVMHACGHDAHIAMLLGAGKILSKIKSRIRGEVILIFQPAEEGKAGAKRMIDEGLFSKYRIDFMFGHHIWPVFLPYGVFATRKEAITSISDRFTVKIYGKGGHAANPDDAVDPIVILGEAITAIYHIVSRNLNPQASAVITIGKVSAGTAENIIPESAELAGTVRATEEKTRDLILERLKEISENIPKAYRGKGELIYRKLYPITYNHPTLTERVLALAREFWGEKRTIELKHPSMGGEDFSFFTKVVPSCFSFIGVGGKINLHSSKFTLNEEILPIGTAWEAFLAIKSGDFKL